MTYKPIIPREELVPDMIYSVHCKHSFRGQLLLSLDYESISTPENEFYYPDFVRYSEGTLEQVIPTYCKETKRFCFCHEDCTRCVCDCANNPDESVREGKRLCECLESGRVKTVNFTHI